MFRPMHSDALLMLMVGSLAIAQQPAPQPAPDAPLRWYTYLSKDLKNEYPHPVWEEPPLQNQVWLKTGQATYTPPAGYTPEKAKFYVRVPGPQPGTWIDPPALTLDGKVVSIGGGKYDFIVKDEKTPPVGFTKGSTVQIQFKVDLKKNADSTQQTILLPPETREAAVK